MEEINDDVILMDEEDRETRFEHVLTFVYEGNRYVALSPVSDEECVADDDEEEIVLLRVDTKNGNDVYSTIDNEVLLNEVFDVFLEYMDEIEEGKNGELEKE